MKISLKEKGYRNSILILNLFLLMVSTESFLPAGRILSSQSHENLIQSRKFLSAREGEKNFQVLKELSVSGVSVSAAGFLVLLDSPNNNDDADDNNLEIPDSVSIDLEKIRKRNFDSKTNSTTLCIRVSCDVNDEFYCSSPEALTIVQLLSQVDMAGAVLPPQQLHHLIALYCAASVSSEESDGYVDMSSQKAADSMLNSIAEVLGETSYLEATPWQRGRIRYPKIKLDSIELQLPSSLESENKLLVKALSNEFNEASEAISLPMKFILNCHIEGHSLRLALFSESISSFGTDLSSSIYLPDATYSYTPASAAFISLSLALRYKAKILISQKTLSLLALHKPNSVQIGTVEELNKQLPQWKSVASIINQSNGVMRNVKSCFEANKLQGALRIAREKGDTAAIHKIQEKLDEFDNFDDLPTIDGMEETGINEIASEQEKDAWA